MTVAIFEGRRHVVVSRTADGLELEDIGPNRRRTHVRHDHPDLIVDPTLEDLDLAEGFERGEVGAFEYADGHTYPPNQEIPPVRSRNARSQVH